MTRAGDGRPVDWASMRFCVAGVRVVGTAAASALLRRGAQVTVVDDGDGPDQWASAARLRGLGANVLLGSDADLPADTQVLLVSPGLPPDHALLAAADAGGVEVWGDVEFAWRLREDILARGGRSADWLCLTGTNGKTTTVRMLESMLLAAGKRAIAAGNVGLPLLEAVTEGESGSSGGAYDVLAVELSSFQLHYASSLRPAASALLNLADDHLDWHARVGRGGGRSDETARASYASDKARIFAGVRLACVTNADQPETGVLAAAAAGRGESESNCRQVSFTLGAPAAGQLGVHAGLLLDRAFGDAIELASVDGVHPPGAHNVANALAAAALARAYNVPAAAIADGLRAFRPDPHRMEFVASVDGVTYVDDSKATNLHAAAASLCAYDDIVWIAGGLAKGATFDDLVRKVRPRLRAVVLIGRDRKIIADALRRHAPDIPVVEVSAGDPDVMRDVVREAASLAVASTPGSDAPGGSSRTVLLAPACSSFDMFRDYGARGDAFASAVRDLGAATAPPPEAM